MKEKKVVPLGTSDFRDLIRDEAFYVDKTLFIHKLFRERAIKVKLFTRPRRFGKTLNLSMIRHFFDIKSAEENKDLFKGFDIEKTKTMEEFGKYPVIFLTFKEINEKTAEKNIKNLCSMISNLYGENNFVKEILGKNEYKEYEKVESGLKEANYKTALRNLIKYLARYYKKEVILLIDEYDLPLIKAYTYDYYEEIIDFYRGVFGGALKDAEGLKFGILTGITRIARENIFSGLNNIEVYSVLSEDYEDFFGFTEEEVEAGLKEYEIENNLEDVKKWYNGYNFNGKSIYNPWSIISFFKKKKLVPYWINTSENELIADSLERFRDKKTFETLEDLFNGKSVTTRVNESIVFKDLKTSNRLWSLMLNSGYLTVEKQVETWNFDTYELKIPNYEIETFFKETFIEKFVLGENRDEFETIIKGLEIGETEEFERKFKEFVFNTVSFGEKDKEGLAHGIIIGITASLGNIYYTKSEREAGIGKYDVYLEPKNKEGFGYIIETKVIKDEKNKKGINEILKKESQKAIEQIKEGKYYSELLERDVKNVNIIGIAFCGKNVEMSIEKVR